MLQKVKVFVNNHFKKYSHEHFARTVYWIKKLKPDSDEALLIAAYAHDIQRGVSPISEGKSFVSGEKLTFHQKEGGKIMYDFLIENGADKKIARRVKNLISKHEVGGTKDQNLLKDADSLSFLETKSNALKRRLDAGFKKKEVKRKVDWMFNRISSNDAKKLARPLYDKLVEKLFKQ